MKLFGASLAPKLLSLLERPFHGLSFMTKALLKFFMCACRFFFLNSAHISATFPHFTLDKTYVLGIAGKVFI